MSDEQGETVESTDADDTEPDGTDGESTPEADLDELADDATPEADLDELTDDATPEADLDELADDATPESVEEVAERVADSDAETVASEIVELRRELERLELELEALEAERDDLEDRLKRKAAEFQNYKKRQEKRREEIRDRATEGLVEELVEVRDNLGRALEQDGDADIRDGVEATFRQLDDVLAGENVVPIEPEPGTEVDPTRHEVLLNVESGRPDGTVAELHRAGYEMAGKVIRPAQVTVAEGEPE